MISSSQQQRCARLQRQRSSSLGFTLLELVLVVAISLTLAGFAIPSIISTQRAFALKSAVSAVNGAIQSTRYQAIFHGCQYAITFTAATYNFTVSSAAPAAGGTACLAAPVAVGAAVPLPGTRITLNGNSTFTFSPSGTVIPGGANPAAGIVLTQANILVPETITVSNNGKITVTP